MSLLKIMRMGNPILRQKAVKLTVDEIKANPTKDLVKKMFYTMNKVGGVGLAAPQVGESKQIIVIHVPDDIPEVVPIRPTVFFNPEIEYLLEHERINVWESCLSVPGLTGKVNRYSNVLVHYLDEAGHRKRVAATGFLAAVFQHEIDHLNGKLYLQNMESITNLMFDQEWLNFVGETPETLYTGSVHWYES